MRKQDFLIFGSPCIGEEEIKEVEKTLRSGWLSTGPRVEKFEELFRCYVGSKYACAVSSCTAALQLSLLAAGVGRGNEVITTPLTYPATANAIIHVGAKPVFVDVDRQTMNLNPSLIEKKITRKTKAIIPVHFAGRPCPMEIILNIAQKYGLKVIEDAAHALGAEYHGKKIGNIGDLTCFSFYANKNITTGEGGMVTTNQGRWAGQIRILSLDGIKEGPWNRFKKDNRPYQTVAAGYKYNMTDIEAAIGIPQLEKLEKFLKRREEVWRRYDKAFEDLPLTRPSPPDPQTRHARHLYTLLIDPKRGGITRDQFRLRLQKARIGTGIHFIALHLHLFYRKVLGYRRGSLPNAEYISSRTVSLPLSPGSRNIDVERVIDTVKNVLSR